MSEYKLFITAEIQIPYSELELTYVRSSGPGGQNVNKVNSKAQLRWNVVESPNLTGEVRFRILAKLGPKLTGEGELLISSDRFRDQIRNREDCFEKLREIVLEASFRPKIRKKTRPTKGSKRRATESKKRQSEKKSSRRSTKYHS